MPEQPTSTSAQQPPSQPPTSQVALPVKKKRTGLIIGIVSGSAVLVLLITLALVYFLWWQNPHKMLADAMSQLVAMERSLVDGKLMMESKQFKLQLDVKAHQDGPQSSTKATFKLSPKEGRETIDMDAEVVFDKDATMYIKINGPKRLLKALLEDSIEDEDLSQTKLLEGFAPIVGRIDGQWLKISPNSMPADGTAAGNCMQEFSQLMRSDPRVRQELAEVFRKHNPLIVGKERLKDRNGGRGFSIDLDAMVKSDKLKRFAEELETTKGGDKLKECVPLSSPWSTTNHNKPGSDKTKQSLRFWVDSWSHQLRAVEFATETNGGEKLTISFDITPNKTKPIKLPKDAKNIQDILKEYPTGPGFADGRGPVSPRPAPNLPDESADL